MNLKKLATSGAALVALTAPAFLASQAHADTNSALNSAEWTGLHTANDGGNNVAYVDKEGLSQTEVAQIKKLLPETKVKGCSIYKLIYEKDASTPTTTNTPTDTTSTSTLPKPVKNFVDKVLPNTGDTTIQAYGTLAGLNPKLILDVPDGTNFYDITADDFKLINYNPVKPQLTFDLAI